MTAAGGGRAILLSAPRPVCSVKAIGAGHLGLAVATALLSLSIAEVSCPRLGPLPHPCLWSQLKIFQ
jgi:hypothetical protein